MEHPRDHIMIDEPISAAICELSNTEIPDKSLYQLLHMVEFDIENTKINFSSFDLQFVASHLHNLYRVPCPQIKAVVLRIICSLEVQSPIIISEKYNFDKLIAESIDKRPADPPPKIDEEKIAAFRCVLLLIRFRYYLPKSIVRALISFYNVPRHSHKPLILAYLGEACIKCHEIENFPGIIDLFIDSLDSDLSAKFTCYAIENQKPFVMKNNSLKRILSPLSHFKNEANSNSNGKGIHLILVTWPGCLYLGIHLKVFNELIKCLSHETASILDIFKNLVRINSLDSSILVPFNGLVLEYLFSNGLIERLNDVSTNSPSAAKFLTELLPLTTHCKTNYNVKLPVSVNEEVANQVIYKISDTLFELQLPISLSDYNLSQDDLQLDWNIIYHLLTVVLPHNESEVFHGKIFFNRLIDYFCSTFLQQPVQFNSKISKSLTCMFQLLLQSSFGVNLLASSQQLKKTVTNMFKILQQNKPIETNSPYLCLFKTFAYVIENPQSSDIFSKWNFFEQITSFPNFVQFPSTVEKILPFFHFNTENPLIQMIFIKYIKSPNDDVFMITVKTILENDVDSFFVQYCLKKILINTIYTIKKERINSILNLIYYFMVKKQESIPIIAEDDTVLQFIKENSHIIYSLFFSVEELLPKLNVEDEIKYWIDIYNIEYVKVFDLAVNVCFDKTIDYSEQPAIIIEKDNALVPPHLYGQLVKTNVGYKILKNFIPSLLSSLLNSSKMEKRAIFLAIGNYGSSKLSSESIIDFQAISSLIQAVNSSTSFLIRGTLIHALSMFSNNDLIENELQNNGFYSFKFGSKRVVVPIDYDKFLSNIKQYEETNIKTDNIPELTEVGEKISKIINPLLSGKIKREIYDKYKSNPPSVATIKNAFASHILLSNYPYTSDSRNFIYSVFKNTPIVEKMKSKSINPQLKCETIEKINFLSSTPLNQIQSFINFNLTDAMKMKIKINALYPEAYFNEETFYKTCNITKSEFYKLSEKDKVHYREMIH